MWNAADLLGVLFLGFGVLDGYRKGLVKKGTSLMITLVTLLAVYFLSPFVQRFFEGILPAALSIEKLAGADSELYRILILSGFGEQADAYIQTFAARILALTVTYIAIRIILRTVVLSLEILVKVPGLSLVNRLLGAGFGLVQQLVTLWIFFLLLTIFSGTGWGGYLSGLIQGSVWMGYLYENNLLLLIGILLILDF